MATGLRTVQQSVSAGNNFDATAPTGTISLVSGVEVYPEGAAGGLFDLELLAPVSVRSVELKLGGQTSWTIHKKDVEGREFLLFIGDTETYFITTEADAFVLTDGQTLLIRTTGASAALFARVSVRAIR